MFRRFAQGPLRFANVVSLVALFVALAGGAYAAGLVGPRDIAKNAVRSKHVKKNALTGADINEAKLQRVGPAPEAFAHVKKDGSVDTVNSGGVAAANVTFDGSDTYCFGGLAFQPRGAQVTDDYDGGFNDTHLQFGLGEIAGCPPGTQGFVWAFRSGTGASQPSNFFIAFYR